MTTTHNHTGATARDNARQHNGNVYNHNTNHYTIRQRRSDETLREDGRNRELLRAAAEGQTRRVEYLIQAGADRDYSDDEGFTALHHAALSGFEDTAEVLVSTYGLDVNAPSLEHGTPLCLAALKARANIVRLLLDARANVNAPGGALGSPLHAACDAGDSEVTRMLLRKGVDACLRRNVKLGGALIVFGAALIPHLECMYRAFTPSRDPDRMRNEQFSAETADWVDCTPLHIAAGGNAADLIAILLEAGATMEASSLRGLPDIQVPPLFYARDRECIAELKRNGANLDQRDSEGQTYLMRVAITGRLQLLRILVSLGASMNLTSLRSGLTALDYALESRCHPCVGYLLAEGASFHRPDQGRPLACHDYEVVLELESARRLRPTEFQRLRDILEGVNDPYGTEATRYLCCQGLDPNRCYPAVDGHMSWRGHTPLTYAVHVGASEWLIETLLHFGGCITAENAMGQNAWSVANETARLARSSVGAPRRYHSDCSDACVELFRHWLRYRTGHESAELRQQAARLAAQSYQQPA